MRTIWRVVVRTIFWSFERGTWPYDVAVVLIVAFVLLTPRSWFNDRPPVGPPSPSIVELHDASSEDGVEVYRVDARLLAASGHTPEPELEHQLHEAVRKNVDNLHQSQFEIVRIDPVRGDDGAIAYYDVSIRP
jgi:hypothetical protein